MGGLLSFKDEQTMKYRNELKYVISESTFRLLRNRIRNMIPLDSHVGEDGRYIIRSLYFDDYFDSCYFENENGTDPREKYRVRIYNYSDKRISLECKRKENGMTHKTSCRLTRNVVESIITDHNQGLSLMNQVDHPLFRRFCKELCYEYAPKIIVEYEREPYIYALGNVRVTFDTNIMSSHQVNNFFDPYVAKRPIMPLGRHLMEVKFDEFLPNFIYDALQIDCLERTAFSKYYLCRKYSI